jgi:hypothetical protein
MAKTKKSRSSKADYIPKPDEQKALDKRATRKTAPAPNLYLKKDGSVGLNHPDVKTAHELLQNALGTSDPDFLHGLLEVLKVVSKIDGKVEEGNLNFFLSVVRGIEPQDQLEAMMAAQMALINLTLFEYRCLFAGDPSCRNDAMTAMNKLARTYAAQMEALKRYRSKGEQKVTVQHVTVSDGGQAIVGDVHQPAKAADKLASPYPPALAHSKQRPMEIGQSDDQPVAVKRRARK